MPGTNGTNGQTTHEELRQAFEDARRNPVLRVRARPYWSEERGEVSETYVEVHCPFCGDYHIHGRTKPSGNLGSRVSHCGSIATLTEQQRELYERFHGNYVLDTTLYPDCEWLTPEDVVSWAARELESVYRHLRHLYNHIPDEALVLREDFSELVEKLGTEAQWLRTADAFDPNADLKLITAILFHAALPEELEAYRQRAGYMPDVRED
jgi:hypothetical protein